MTKRKNPGTAVYLRISEDKLGLELGIDRQRAECVELCARRGWPDPVEFADNDISATNGAHRPGYAALMGAVGAGELARVVVWHPSRIWRNRAERAAGIEVMKAHRITLECVKGPSLDMATAYGRGLAGLVGEFDTMESEVKSERINASIAQRARRGELNGAGSGNRLVGYADDGKTVIEAEAEQVRSWFARFLAGQTVGSLAREAGVHPTVMRNRLRNPRYAGIRLYRGQEYSAAWPGIVSRDQWEAACRVLADPKRVTNGGSIERKHLGSGLYACGRCDGLRKVYSAYYSRDRHIYRCRPELGGCSRAWHRERLDAYVTALVEERLGRGDLAELLPVDRPDLEALRDEAEGIRGRLARLRSDYVLLGMDETDLAEGMAAGRARLAEIERQLGDPTRGGVLGQLVACEDPVTLWRSIPVEQVSRRQAIVRAVMTITLDAAPRGKPSPDWETSVARYGHACVNVGPPVAC